MSPAPLTGLEDLEQAIEVITGQPPLGTQRAQFAKYLELLRAWNRTHHLSSYQTPSEIVHKLFIDSLLFLPLLPPRPIRLVDIGAGPGIPGIPLRLVDSRIALTLVESRRKPVSFLSAVKRELGLGDMEVVHGRAGAETAEYKGQYDCVVMRGVALEPELLSAARSYLRPDGRIVASGPPPSKGKPPEISGAQIEEVYFRSLGLRRLFFVFSASPGR